jgi:hypothetical protein
MGTCVRAAAVFLSVSLFASAQSFWDGNAAVQRGDSRFESGSFAASNSFPADTQILIENLETGKTTKAVVSQRMPSQSDLLVLLSPRAAAEIGISQGRIAPVRVKVQGPLPAEGQRLPTELALSPDPDINPAAGVPPQPEARRVSEAPREPAAEEPALAAAAPAETPAQEAAPAPTEAPRAAAEPSAGGTGALESLPPAAGEGRVEMAQAPPPEPAPAAENAPAQTVPETPAAEPPREPLPAETVESPAAETPQEAPVTEVTKPPAEDSAAVQEQLKRLSNRSPQKQLFLPPREDERFVYQKPAEPAKPQEKQPEPPKVELAQNPVTEPPKEGPVAQEPPQAAELPTREPAPEIPTVNSLPGHAPPRMSAPDLALAEAGFPIEMNPEVVDRVAAREPGETAAGGVLPEPPASGETPTEAPPLTAELSGKIPAPPEVKGLSIVAMEPAAPSPETEKVAQKPAEEPPAVVKPVQKPAEAVPEVKPVQKPAEAVIALQPAEKKPPGETPAVKAVVPVKPALKPKGKAVNFYLQLAAYATEKQAKDTAARLANTYPVSVAQADSKGSPVYRILVGPLNKAETGTLLVWFRYRGFPDAFVKTLD